MADPLQTATVLGAALALAGLLTIRLRLVPAVGYLLVGVGVAAAWPAHPVHGPGADALIRIAILILLFLIGLELDIRRLRQAFRETAWVLPFHVAVPAAAAALITRLAGWSFTQALLAGMALAISSTLFGDGLSRAVPVSDESRRRFLGQSIAEDVASAGLLAVAVVLAGEAVSLLAPGLAVVRIIFFMTLLAAAALILVPRLLDHVARHHVPEVLLLWSLAAVAAFGYLGHLAGSAELGAFLAGVAAAEAGSRYVVRNILAGVRALALASFFFVAGLAVDVAATLAVAPLVLLLTTAFIAAKFTVNSIASAAAGQPTGDAMRTAILLATLGEFSLIMVTVAERDGLAHPDMRAVVVGCIVVALLVSNVLMRAAPALDRRVQRLPPRVRKTGAWLLRGLRRPQGAPHATPANRRAIRLLLSNLALLVAWGIAAAFIARRFMPDAAALHPFWGPTVLLGGLLGAAVPMLRGAYRAYRDTVWHLVGLRPGEGTGAGRVRARLVDVWVLASATLVLVFVALRIPQALPIVLGAAFIAVILAALAWRRLTRFHRTLEGTLTRVLGEDPEAGRVLDTVMQRYPWGVRFAAVAVPPDSPAAGHTVRQSRIAELTGAMVALLQRKGLEIVNPGPDVMIHAGDTLVLLGDHHQIERAEALVVSHGEALRLEAQSRSAHVEELTLASGSAWAGRSLRDIGIRENTGVLVLGVLHGAGAHPKPYEPDAVLAAGDRIIVLGTPLQVGRARAVAEGHVPPN